MADSVKPTGGRVVFVLLRDRTLEGDLQDLCARVERLEERRVS